MQKVTRETYSIDAEGKVLGRLATDIAMHLIGKHRPDFQKHLDLGDNIEVQNVDKMVITGKKLDHNSYYRHSGFPGGIKEMPMKKLMDQNPAEVLRFAVSRMLPKNKHRVERMKRLNIK